MPSNVSFEYDSSGQDTGRQVTFEGVTYKEVTHTVLKCRVVRDNDGTELSRSPVDTIHDAFHWEPAGDTSSSEPPLCYNSAFWRLLDEEGKS
jgi:hypothetical protein